MKLLRFFAASEVAGGAALLLGILGTWHDCRLPLWYQISSLLLAFYAIVAGLSLWKKHPLGLWLSLVLQVVQVVQIVTSTFLFQTFIGFHVLYFEYAGGGVLFEPGFGATLGLWGAGHGMKPGGGINLLAFGLVLFLFNAIKETPEKLRTGEPILTS